VSRQRIEDMDVTIVRFANGSSLTFKRTEFDKGSVSVKLRFGAGFAGLPNDWASLSWLEGAVVPSGLGKLDLDALERLLNGRKMSMGFAIEEDTFVLRGLTNGTELGDQLRLLAAKLAAPRWDAAVVERLKTGAIEGYDLAFSSASSRAGREFGQVTHPGDRRWAPVEKAQIAAATPAAFESFFAPLLAGGPIDAIIVGDVDLETAVGAMRRSIAALPPRPRADPPAALLQVAPPAPSPRPATFTHQGDKDQAYAVIGWSTFGGTGRIKEQRALALAASMLQVRLFERLREAEGASYSPSAASAISQTLPEWGIFYVSSAIRPESTDLFFRIAREIVADLATKPAEADEFARAQNPVLSGIERRVKTNPYWLAALEDWTDRPERIEQARSFAADYRALTAAEVRDAVARHVADAGDWSMLVLPGKASGGGN
jgi:zinc protease